MRPIPYALAVAVLITACSKLSPLAPSAPAAGARIVLADYLIPASSPLAKTGAHRLVLAWDGAVLTFEKGGIWTERWSFDGTWWRHEFDNSDGRGPAGYRLLEGDRGARWLPAEAAPGASFLVQAEEEREGVRRPFPYRVTVLGAGVEEIGGRSLDVVRWTYQPEGLRGEVQPASREEFWAARGEGLVRWRAAWNGDVWLDFWPAGGAS